MKLACSMILLFAVAARHPVPFERDGRWGYQAPDGRVAISARFVVAEPFSAEGLAAVADERGWAYIDLAGRVVIRPLVVDNGPDYFREDLARFRRGGKVGFFDRRGKVVLEPEFDFALPFSAGLAAVCRGCTEVLAGEHTILQGGKWGYIDRRGVLVIPLEFERAESFERGVARVRYAGQWTRIDKKGNRLENEPKPGKSRTAPR